MHKMDKFNNYEEWINNQMIIDEMIKGDKKEVMIPKSGEFFVLKSKKYDDPSIALKIPLNDLLDGTKTAADLKKKYGEKKINLYDQDTLPEISESENVSRYDVHKPSDNKNDYSDKNYMVGFTTDLKDITSVQQKKFLAPSSRVIADVREQISDFRPSNNQDSIMRRPISAQVLFHRAEKNRIQSGKTNKTVAANQMSSAQSINLTEKNALSTVARKKIDVKTIKKNTYQIKARSTVSGISGYKSLKLMNPDEKEKIEKAEAARNNSKYSPFLLIPMDEVKEEADENLAESSKSTKLFSLEYFIFPEYQDKDDVKKIYNDIKTNSLENEPIFGYSRFFFNDGNFEWRR